MLMCWTVPRRALINDLMSGNKEVTRGIVHVLCDYTRQNLARAKN